MPVPASINDLSTTAGNNSPAGSESPTLTDNYLRAISAFIASLRDSIAGLVKQDSATDSAAGRLLTVGAFGLGGPAILQSGDINSLSVTQFFQTNASTTNVPIGAGTSTGQGYGVHIQHSTAGYATQRWVQLSTNRAFERVKNSGTWLPWVELFHTGNVSSFAQTLLDDADAAAARITLGVVNSVGASQTWQNLTASRALGTNYTNSTAQPIEVAVTVIGTTPGVSITVDGVVIEQMRVQISSGNTYACVSAIVPPGSTYSAAVVAMGALHSWSELR